jgi:hypothetical protein
MLATYRYMTARGEPFDSLVLSLSKGELAQDRLVEPLVVSLSNHEQEPSSFRLG